MNICLEVQIVTLHLCLKLRLLFMVYALHVSIYFACLSYFKGYIVAAQGLARRMAWGTGAQAVKSYLVRRAPGSILRRALKRR